MKSGDSRIAIALFLFPFYSVWNATDIFATFFLMREPLKDIEGHIN